MPADHTPTDETVLRQPATPISPQGIAEMRRALSLVTFLHPAGWYRNGEYVRSASTGQLLMQADACGVNDVQFAADAPKRVERLLDAIEALTAENARLSEESHRNFVAANREYAERRKAEAELTELRLQCLAYEGQAHAAYEAQKRAEAEVERLKGERSNAVSLMVAAGNSLEAAGIVCGKLDRAIEALTGATDHGRYATQRAKVEADFAATKQGAEDAAFAAVVKRQIARAEAAAKDGE